jgi:hypothetical protein
MRLLVRVLAVTLLLVVSATLARAQTFAGLDLMSSTIFQQHQSSFSGLGGRVRLHSASIVEGFELLPSIEYWRSSMHIDVWDATMVRKDATLGADVRYSFRHEGWKPYIGAGVGAHFLSSEIESSRMVPSHAQDSVIKGGVTVLAGMTFPMSTHLDNFVEAKYHHIPGFSQFKINMGIGWGF